MAAFKNDDEVLKKSVISMLERRMTDGIVGCTGTLERIIIRVDEGHLRNAVEEFMRGTNFAFRGAWEDKHWRSVLLHLDNSADVLFRERIAGEDEFENTAVGDHSKHIPHTRVTGFVFQAFDIHKWFEVQTKKRGFVFATGPEILENDYCYYVQAKPSVYTGNVYGFIQWKSEGDRCHMAEKNYKKLDWDIKRPEGMDFLANVGPIDHAASRMVATDRDPAVLEFLSLTDYGFAFAIYTLFLNSITSVCRAEKETAGKSYAMVFTSGISNADLENDPPEKLGPTEQFVKNYGRRVHHFAYRTKNIEQTFEDLKKSGMKFLCDMLGNEEEGLKQTFSEPAKHTLIVNEYIHRYGDFTGFFTKSNVRDLTEATFKQ